MKGIAVSHQNVPHESSGYWYGTGTETVSAVDLLNLMRRYREAEVRMRARVRGEMGMGEKDILALRYLLDARARSLTVRQKDLAAKLDITTPSASVLVDRLVRDGYARRVPHPDDRRSVALEATDDGDREVRETLRLMHDRLFRVADEMTDSDRAIVAAFLTRMISCHDDANASPSDH